MSYDNDSNKSSSTKINPEKHTYDMIFNPVKSTYTTLAKPVKETYTKYKTTILTSIITAIAVLVSLAWNNVIQAVINYYYPLSTKATIKGKTYYALIITIFVILLQLYVFPFIMKYLSSDVPQTNPQTSPQTSPQSNPQTNSETNPQTKTK